MTIYTSNPGWIPQPGRITRSWPSGLVLLQQEFVGRIDTDGDIAVPGDPFPADAAGTGAKVYSMPEYRDLGNGFQIATVTAYGSTPGAGQKIESISVSSGTIMFVASYYDSDGTLRGMESTLSTDIVSATEVKTGTGDLSLIQAASDPSKLKTFSRSSIYGVTIGQDLNGHIFNAYEIWPNTATIEATATFVNTIYVSRTDFTYFGSVWEARATIGPTFLASLDFGLINQEPE